MENKGILIEIWDFMRINKKWWLLPIILMLLFVGVLVIFGQGSATSGISPFIYALF